MSKVWMVPDLLSIVVVSYNTRELLRRCLASITDNPHHEVVSAGAPIQPPHGSEESATPDPEGQPHRIRCEVVVVDNGSRDESAEMVAEEFPAVQLIQSGSNLGFARATNDGLRASRGSLLLLLNPDTEVIGDALPTLAQFLMANDRVAAVGPALLYSDGSPQHAAFRFPNLWMSFFDFFPLNHRLINSRLNGRYPVPFGGSAFPVDHLLGAAIMIKQKPLQETGLLDESFFMYCEEVDWCLRARRRGWQIYQLPTARVIHHGGQSTAQFREKMLVELHRSRYQLFRKHYPPCFITLHRAITRVGLAREWLRARWLALTGQMDSEELQRRLWAYHTIWSM